MTILPSSLQIFRSLPVLAAKRTLAILSQFTPLLTTRLEGVAIEDERSIVSSFVDEREDENDRRRSLSLATSSPCPGSTSTRPTPDDCTVDVPVPFRREPCMEAWLESQERCRHTRRGIACEVFENILLVVGVVGR